MPDKDSGSPFSIHDLLVCGVGIAIIACVGLIVGKDPDVEKTRAAVMEMKTSLAKLESEVHRLGEQVRIMNGFVSISTDSEIQRLKRAVSR